MKNYYYIVYADGFNTRHTVTGITPEIALSNFRATRIGEKYRDADLEARLADWAEYFHV